MKGIPAGIVLAALEVQVKEVTTGITVGELMEVIVKDEFKGLRLKGFDGDVHWGEVVFVKAVQVDTFAD